MTSNLNSINIKENLKNLFPEFDEQLLDFISKNAMIRSVETGKQLIQPGQYFRSVILVLSGKVKVYRHDDEGNEFFMYYIEPGSACALSMVCAARNLMSDVEAVATEETQLAMIPIELMDNLVKNYKTWYYFVLETYRNRFGELLQVIDSIAFKAMDERVEFYLKRQLSSTRSYTLNITHEQIATDLNSSRVVISRLLKKMEQDKKLQLFRNSIEMSSKFYPL